MVGTTHVPMMDLSACSLMPALDLTAVVHLSPPSVEVAVVVDPGPD